MTLSTPAVTLLRSGSVNATFASSSLPAAAGYLESQAIGVQDAKSLTLYVGYDARAAGGRAQLICFASGERDEPQGSSDSWYELAISNGVANVSGALAGAFPAGMVVTGSDLRATSVYQGNAITLMSASAATSKIREAVTVDVTPYRFVKVLMHEVGVVGTPGTGSIKYSKNF